LVYEYGDIIYEYQYDEYGDYLYDDEGNPLLLLDLFGNPVPQLDEFGNPLREVFTRSPTFEAALAWVGSNLQPVPEPGAMISVAIALLSSCCLRLRRAV
jgi:hypothetical protein